MLGGTSELPEVVQWYSGFGVRGIRFQLRPVWVAVEAHTCHGCGLTGGGGAMGKSMPSGQCWLLAQMQCLKPAFPPWVEASLTRFPFPLDKKHAATMQRLTQRKGGIGGVRGTGGAGIGFPVSAAVGVSVGCAVVSVMSLFVAWYVLRRSAAVSVFADSGQG